MALRDLAGLLASGGFVWLASFQIALAAGVPIGRLAWGGADARLTGGQRWASLAVAGLAMFGLAVAGQAAGWWRAVPDGSPRPILWGLVALFTASFILNLMSASRAERLHGVALTATLVIGCAALLLL